MSKIKIPKGWGHNICLDCIYGYQFSPKNRTCYCSIEMHRSKCVTECDDFYPKGN